MPLFLEEIEFRVEDKSWGNKENDHLKGIIKASVGAELGNVLDNEVTVYHEMTFGVSKLPKEIQERLIEIYKDVQKYLNENSKLKIE